MMETFLQILFLRKFEQFAQMEEVLKRSLATVLGRKALVDVLSARVDQWAACSNKQVFDKLRDVALTALAAIDALPDLEQFCMTESGSMLRFVNVGQTYYFESETGGDRVYLQSRLREFKLWNEMRLWNSMLALVLGDERATADVVARRNRRQVLSVFRQVLPQELQRDPETLKGTVVARHLTAFAYVMLGQLAMPLQPVSTSASLLLSAAALIGLVFYSLCVVIVLPRFLLSLR
eukprot:SAG31_NODE_1778_length_7297_cov_10.330786_9_plen_235_part_01